jgi:hypothetical protein
VKADIPNDLSGNCATVTEAIQASITTLTGLTTIGTSGAAATIKGKNVFDNSVLTISATDLITPTKTFHTLDPVTSQDLRGIVGGTIGQILVLMAKLDNAVTGEITVYHDSPTTGKKMFLTGGNKTLKTISNLNEDKSILQLIFDGTQWCQISYADNTTIP